MSTTFDVESAPAARWTPATAWRNWRKARRQTASLSALSDHQVHDIGFHRDRATDRILRRS
jgi:uncharacterized protein YjiS (DUF1127 family)